MVVRDLCFYVLPLLVAQAVSPPVGLGQDSSGAEEAEVTPEREAELAFARSLFYEGVELLDARRFEEAAQRLERVRSIRNSPVVSYNLASAYAELGRYVEARELLGSVQADQTATPEALQAAESLLQTVESSLGRVRVHLSGPTKGLIVQVGEREFSPSQLEAPVLVDPGTVRVVARRGDEQVAARLLTLTKQTSLEADVELEIAPVAKASRAVPPPHDVRPAGHAQAVDLGAVGGAVDRADDGSVFEQWWFWTAVGVVAMASVSTALVLGRGPEPADPGTVRGDFSPALLEGQVQ